MNVIPLSFIGNFGGRFIYPAIALLMVVAGMLLPTLLPAQEPVARFAAVDIFVDSGAKPLAAYQLEFRVRNGEAKIAGVEGGTHPAFNEPPFYDPKAIQGERVVLAAFNTSTTDKLPRGKIRVATIHMQLTGSRKPEFEIALKTAGSPDGKKILAKATFEPQTR